MTQSLLKSRLLASAQSAPEQLQPDFEAQWKTRARVTPRADKALTPDIFYD